MKLPEIPLPEPVFMITVTRGGDRGRRATVQALRFLLWLVPACTVDYILLAVVHGGCHSLLLTEAASFIVLAIAVLTVNAEDGGDGDVMDARRGKS